MKRTVSLLLVLALVGLPGPSPTTYADLDPRDSANPYGVLSFLGWNHDWNYHHYSGRRLETAVALLRESGVGFVRMDFLWDDIEPAPGKFVFEKYDRIVGLLEKSDIKVLGLLSYNAVWAAEYWNSAPDEDRFVRYARAVVRRYKDRVRYWEIWNEPDDAQFWREQDSMKRYARLLRAVYAALKEEDPTCVVLMGGLSQTIPQSLANLYRNGAGDSFDVVNIHPFVDPKRADAPQFLRGILKGVRKVMEQYGDGRKDIWITEIGCPGVEGGESGWWLGSAPTEAEQAAWVRSVYAEAFSMPGVKKVFWAFFQDTPNYFRSAVDHFGLIRKDFSKKPAFETYKRLVAGQQ
jgi:hypothetical protein